MSFKLQFLAIGISIAAMAIVPSIVNSTLAQPQSGGAANSILFPALEKTTNAPPLHKRPPPWVFMSVLSNKVVH
ncbi:MAG TPA: hypothetical protein VFR94_08750 [Nitrososphaeraceae archaeon]|nr:hypothetical protein [Nitrososphaeraceae archaeon]